MAKAKKLVRCEIRWDKRGQYWYDRELVDALWRRKGISIDVLHGELRPMTKAEFVRSIVNNLKARVADGAYGFSLRICNKNGRYAVGDKGEKTFPKNLDPRSRG